MNFFSWYFPLHEFFFVFSPPPHHFSNGPSLSNGCCCVGYHFLVRISLRFGTAGWYGIMKGKIRFLVFFVGGGLVPFFKFHFRECVVNKVLPIASLPKVFLL